MREQRSRSEQRALERKLQELEKRPNHGATIGILLAGVLVLMVGMAVVGVSLVPVVIVLGATMVASFIAYRIEHPKVAEWDRQRAEDTQTATELVEGFGNDLEAAYRHVREQRVVGGA